MKIRELLEARRNPELNPKVSINDEIHDFGKTFGNSTSFVSFTSVDKLGINPLSKYETPLGLYAYPLEYVIARIGAKNSPAARLPFAGDQPYATLFSVDPKRIIFLSKFSQADLDSYIGHMKQIYPSDHAEIERALTWAKSNAMVKTAGGIMWGMTMMFAGMNTPESRNRSIKWNKIFRDLGIDGVVDDGGDGIIHGNERTQAVFFKKPGVIKNEKRIYNKYSRNSLETNLAKAEIHKTARAVLAAQMEKHNGDPAAIFNELMNGMFDQSQIIRALPKPFLDSISVEAVTNQIFLDTDIDDLAKVIKFTKHITGRRWAPGEAAILKAILDGEDAVIGQNYCIRNMGRKRWPEFEKVLLRRDDGFDILDYAETIIGGRWQAAEPQLKLQDRYWKRYRIAFNVKETT